MKPNKKIQPAGIEVQDNIIRNKQNLGLESMRTIVPETCQPNLHQAEGELDRLNKGDEVKKKHKKKRKSKTSDKSAEHHRKKRPKLDSCNLGSELADSVSRILDGWNVAG